VACRCPRLVRGEHGAHRQPGLGVARRPGQIELDAVARRHPRHVQLPRLGLDAVLLDGPREPQVAEVEHLVQVRDAQAPVRRAGDPHRLDHLGELVQPRRRGAVREEQPVGHEVAVVQLLAEVAAVAEELAALRVAGADAVVDPLPHEPALAAGVGLEQLLVLAEPARPVAHRVGVLAEHERRRAPRRVLHRVDAAGGLLAAADEVGLGLRGVHPAVDVGPAPVGAVFVVHRAARVAVLRVAVHPLQVAAGPRLVAQRPHDHARVVLVALHHPPHPVLERVAPGRVVGGVAAPAHVHEAVGLEVALVHDVQAVLVAQLEEAGVRRVVAGADSVDVVPLHQQHVVEHVLLGDGPAAVGVELVPVHPAQQHPVAVDGEQPVLDPDRAEPHPQVDALACRHDRRVVEPGHLGAPRLHALDPHLLARGHVDPQLGDEHPRISGNVDAQRACAVVVAGVHEDVVHPARGPGQQRDVAEDPGHPPHVLVLEVAARRPLVHAHGHQVVCAGSDGVGDVELGRQPAALRRADLVPVDPDGEAGVDALEPQHDPLNARRR
jgi:hypothetical protein